MNSMEWNDLRVILAIGREGSLSGAARAMRNDHSTVFRKLNAIEARTGVRFFERINGRYSLTDAGVTALALAERMEDDFRALERSLLGRDARLQGEVRVSASEGFALIVLPPLLAEFQREHPGVTLDLINEFGPSDLARREADVAVRVTRSPPDSSLGRFVCDLEICVYASHDYLERSGRRALPEYDWIVFEPTASWHVPTIFPSEDALGSRKVLSTNSVIAATFLARDGMGVLAMSAFLADPEPDLVRIAGPFPDITLQLWVLTHPDLRNTARVTQLTEFLARRLRRDRAKFEGLT